MNKHLYLALPAHSDKSDWQESPMFRFLILLKLTPEALQQLTDNLAATAPLQDNENIGFVTFNFPQGEFTPLGDEPASTHAAITELTNKGKLQLMHGNIDTVLNTNEGYLLFSSNTPLVDELGENATYFNELRVTPSGSPSVQFNGHIEHFDMVTWMSSNPLYQSDLTAIEELYNQHA